MFRQNDILDFLESQFPYKFSPNNFKNSKDDGVAVLFEGGSSGKHVKSPVIQFLIRAKKESTCETMAFDLYEFFDYKTNFTIGEVQVIMSRGQQASPIYTGTDDNDRHIYSVNMIFTVSNY
jgi:Bacteriophage minor capsid protein